MVHSTIIVAATLAVAMVGVGAITFKDCWLLFGGVDDVGWTHVANLGRLDIYHHLQRKYPNHTFVSRARSNTFLISERERQGIIDAYIADGCNIIFAMSDVLLNGREDELVKTYPNISWVRHTAVPRSQPDEAPPNLIEPINIIFPVSFVAGAVAASFSETCGAFINAKESCLSCFKHVMGFAMGYRWRKPNQTVHVVTMGGYYNPDAEVLAAKQIVTRFGCDVFNRHTDPNDVDRYLHSEHEGKVLSIARYLDMSTFVGDTVFTSQTIDYFRWLLPSVEASFLSAVDGNPGPMYDPSFPLEDRAPLVATDSMEIAPFTSAVNGNEANRAVKEARAHLEARNPLCGARYRRDGPGNGTLLPPEEGEACPDGAGLFHLDPANPLSYLELPGVRYHDAFRDGGAECGGGERYAYDDDLALECLPCPRNTYRLEAGRSEDTCIPCEGGTMSEPGSRICGANVEADLRLIKPGVRHYGYFLVALIAGVALAFAGWVCYYRSSRTVTASQPLFLYLFCSGVLTLGSSILPLTVDDAVADQAGCDKACVAFPWLLSLGFCTAFSALFSKIWRVNRVMTAARRLRRVQIEAKDVLIPLAVMCGLNILLLLLWTVLDPPTWSRIPTNEIGSSFGTCWSNWGPASRTLASLLIALNLLAVVFANVQAYKARNVSDELSESKYVAMAMASILQVLLVGVPLSALVYEEPTAFFFVVSSVILIVSMSLLLLIFVPKVFLLRKERRDPSRRSSLTGVQRSMIMNSAPVETRLEQQLADANKRHNDKEKELKEAMEENSALKALLLENGIKRANMPNDKPS